jgi:hypothetical protein
LKTLTFLSLLRTARTLLNLLSLTHSSLRPKLFPIHLHLIFPNIRANLPDLVQRDHHLPSGFHYLSFPREELGGKRLEFSAATTMIFANEAETFGADLVSTLREGFRIEVHCFVAAEEAKVDLEGAGVVG